MRLKSLYIEDYKNLKAFELDFSLGNGLTMIIGNNGSGKSNLLELISAIFYDAYRKNDFKIETDYSIKFSINDEDEIIIKKKSGRRYFYINEEIYNHKHIIDNDYLPSNVIGIYSGEELRLWDQYYLHYYKSYVKKIEENVPISKMKLMFINKYYWNIGLLTLLLSRNDSIVPFVREELKIVNVNNIILSFDKNAYDKSNNELLKAFIKRFNPGLISTLEVSDQELKNMIFFNVMTDDEGRNILNEEDKVQLIDSGVIDSEVFNHFVQAHMSDKNKIITDIQIIFNDILTTEQLSEGEKKLILLKSVLEFIADEKSLILLDEPDAHIHEARKKKLYNMLLDYVSFNRQVLLSTHSPTLAQNAMQSQLIMLESNAGNVMAFEADKIKKIQNLASDDWNVIEQSLIFGSSDPLIVVEGKTDVKYIKKAFEVLGQTDEKYRKSIDIVSANGAGNTQFFVSDLIGLSPDKKIVVLFDRDDAGKKGAASVLRISSNDEKIVNYNDIHMNNITVAFIPYREGITNGDFLIEDYFLESTIKLIIEELMPGKMNPVKNLPDLARRMKMELEKRYTSFTPEDFYGFVPLLDKIIALMKEKNECL